MKPTSVIIMDTHPIIRMSIEVLLQKNSELQIVLKTDDYRITIDYLRTRPVDLIIMDIDLPGSDSNLLIVFYVQIMPDDLVMQLHRF